LRKDNTGYDLKQLFIGSEGSLGVVTAAALKLFPKPLRSATAFVALDTPAAAVALLRGMQHATGGLVSGFELMSDEGLGLVLKHIPNTAMPLSAHAPWYVLVEATAGEGFDLAAAFEKALAAELESGGVRDAVISSSEAQRKELWRLRESLSEAQKHAGASIKHDVSVPVASLPAFLDKASAAVRAFVPGARPVPFGHLGDGNIHFNISAPLNGDADAFLAKWDAVNRLVHDIVREFNGSISAEHGIGVMKRDSLPRYKSETELDVMRLLKRTLDPKNILNPGKVIPL
jgi:FAD/FMN-containing dehydrogenase